MKYKKMAEENIHRKRIEEPPEGAMPEDSPQETAARQSAEDSPLPPADLPVDGKGEKGPDSPKKDYIEKIKEYYEKLFSNESNLTKILNENGLKVLAPWVKRTRKLLEEDEIAKSCLGYTLDALSKKYQNGTEELEKVILENNLNQIPEIRDETTKAILGYYRHALEAAAEKTRSEKNLGIIEEQIKKVKILLGEDVPDAGEMTIDKSGENSKQKEMRKKIVEAIRQAIAESVARIDAFVEKKKILGVDYGRLEHEKGKIRHKILENIDGHAGLILKLLGDEYESPLADQLIITEARRVATNAFSRGQEIIKILPKGKISGDAEQKKGSSPAPDEPAPNLQPGEVASLLASEAHQKKGNGEAMKEREYDKLNEEQKKKYVELVNRAGITNLNKEVEKKYKEMKPEDADKARKDNMSILNSLKRVFREIVSKENFDVAFFQRYFLNPEVLDDYFEEKKERKISTAEESGKFKNEFRGELEGEAGKAGYDKENAKLIIRYYNSRILLEEFIRGAKKS
ncbi:MAG: hypothetical protein A2374_00240 [Candidatus Moranbacteria bacterium RIFOXYB1_FULL_44_23]|nr:MAG: hypothetical protein A2194_04680 [Candidatus Moranbacteria bacterium RIFOXYA1_FULL_44_8]OGI35287.1 MAG: hypothetical protein A2407_05070 [Candidatus Moranbacteria bacterium RIFOXYC1_FULL_44_8]OGI40661.1 MAG: hypothetical protein A2374_00240 [Candidatus Moranbacteria bacterium RIFOXYB1_FULL_44_23]OGI43133.1 MAG: hypothetical protein A2593_00220 [Candidatus Moranbacteria bacterium RIFOXYD1_FULL_44_9]HBB36395.1 hypothetical protein [Candidatus Moranbacteria bacterium]